MSGLAIDKKPTSRYVFTSKILYRQGDEDYNRLRKK